MGSTRALGVVAAALVLSGCATATLPEPGFGAGEWTEIVHERGDQYWESFGFPAELRPAFPTMELVSQEDYSPRYAQCMNDAGYDNYLPDGSIEATDPANRPEPELIDSYQCSMRIVIRPEESGMLNRAEREYWYDYFEQWLVPCLQDHGIEIAQAQSRKEFDEGYGWWNPYFAVPEADRERVSVDEQLHADCSPVPPGAADPGYFGFSS